MLNKQKYNNKYQHKEVLSKQKYNNEYYKNKRKKSTQTTIMKQQCLHLQRFRESEATNIPPKNFNQRIYIAI